MKVFPDAHAEYVRRHNPIWPELERTLLAHGVLDYSIFLDPETGFLFGYVEIESEARWNAIAGTRVCRQWWDSLVGLMETLPDHQPRKRDLKEVFHIEK